MKRLEAKTYTEKHLRNSINLSPRLKCLRKKKVIEGLFQCGWIHTFRYILLMMSQEIENKIT